MGKINNEITSIMIVGVGGQGTLLASRILGNVAIKKGYDVKVSEVHGMSQRGGSVVTMVTKFIHQLLIREKLILFWRLKSWKHIVHYLMLKLMEL